MNQRPLSQVLVGLLIVAVGVSALLVQLGAVDLDLGELIATWWPLVIVLAGAAALVSVPRAWIGPVTVIAVGVFLQLSTLGLITVNLWSIVWPIAIILFGLTVLTGLGTRAADDKSVNSAVIWWGSERRTTSHDFRGGSLSAIMGGISVDLREADIVDRAEISVFVFWGGVDIKVPPTWRVRVGGLPLLGGWEDKTSQLPGPDAPELVVHITAIMGGVDIKN
ncbi:hypothetical protein DDP54_07345 [Cellulomonas sp. WB94]|uniref:LiaF transmembrane domain-containing protein n=1 Tax=Cellulomonas sp. WB94 TaxID=2173174 RepID=UPI000D566F4C|nr:DUF5668 domain-containing protein [Cellulomonas sp. WB94]PVU82848.1 hypothetical protein DDP54_07345 [Cellulomonas sp. WB94]